jgi:phosphatidylglycerol---prolipoprotein diacylglyceryl transferase
MNLYALLAGLGASLGLWLAVRKAGVHDQAHVLAAGLACLAAALLGARFSFVFLHWAYFSSHPAEIARIWMGGLWWPGALLLAALACLLYARWRHISLPGLADGLMPVFFPLCAGLWLGCWLSGCAYGPAAPQGAWWGVPSPDEAGVWASRLPLQFLSIALFAGFTLLIDHLAPLLRRGAAASLAIAALGLALLPLAIFRLDYLPRLLGLRLDAWAALAMVLAGTACWGVPLWVDARGKASTQSLNPG